MISPFGPTTGSGQFAAAQIALIRAKNSLLQRAKLSPHSLQQLSCSLQAGVKEAPVQEGLGFSGTCGNQDGPQPLGGGIGRPAGTRLGHSTGQSSGIGFLGTTW